MSTNKAPCRNTTSPPWHPEPLSNQVFSHNLRPWEFAFFSPQGTDADWHEWKTERALQLSASETWDPATRCLHQKDSPHWPAIFTWALSSRMHPRSSPVRALNFCLALPQSSCRHPVCQQVLVHTINLERESERRDGRGEFVGGRRGGKVGQRT